MGSATRRRGSEAVNDAVVDDLGQVFVTGFSDSLGFVTMLDSTGAPIWQRTFGDSSGTFNDTAGRALALTGLGGVFVVGHFSSVLHLDLPSSPLDWTTATGTGFLFEFDGAGNFGWARQLGGRGDDVVLDQLGRLTVTGTFHGTADFDPGSGLHILTAVGPSDGYVMRFSPSSGVPVRPTPSPGDPILPATGADTVPLQRPAHADPGRCAALHCRLDANPPRLISTSAPAVAGRGHHQLPVRNSNSRSMSSAQIHAGTIEP